MMSVTGQIVSTSFQVVFPESTFASTVWKIPAEIVLSNSNHVQELKELIAEHFGIDEHTFYLIQNGRLVGNLEVCDPNLCITVVQRMLGGKGGFGSMLRAIGAQIEKTTNRDACRDLSGRRLRDINEEQRLKRWFAKQAEREQEKEEQKQRKLQKLRQIQDGPSISFIEDPDFNRQREEVTESVFEAVDQGFQAAKDSKEDLVNNDESSSSAKSDNNCITESLASQNTEIIQQSTSQKEPLPSNSKPVQQPKKKLKRLMMDEDFDSDLSSDDSDCEPTIRKKAKLEK